MKAISTCYLSNERATANEWIRHHAETTGFEVFFSVVGDFGGTCQSIWLRHHPAVRVFQRNESSTAFSAIGAFPIVGVAYAVATRSLPQSRSAITEAIVDLSSADALPG